MRLVQLWFNDENVTLGPNFLCELKILALHPRQWSTYHGTYVELSN